MARVDRVVLCGLIGLVLACAGRASAQVASAQVGGQVTDPSGSAVAGATAKMVEIARGQNHAAITNDEGRYTVLNLPIGAYRLEVTAPGFKTYVQTGIELQVGNNVQLNIALQVGNVSENIEVSASANLVETEQNAIAQVIDSKRIENLPLNGRQATQLVLISGAAVTAPAGDQTGSKNYFSSTTISIAGGQSSATNYMLDGGENVDTFSNVNLPFPFPDALQEFSVETSTVPARNGRQPGGVVNVVTKSGSNTLHGSAFEFLRNGNVNARNYFAATHDTLKRNQFGGTLGGKIIKDKLFFFGGYQGTRNRQNPPSTIAFIPTEAAKAGDFSALESAGCQSNKTARALKDPTTGVVIPNNFISPSRFDPAALALLKYIPKTADPCGRYVYGVPTTGDENQFIGRIDYTLNPKHSVFARYFLADYTNPAHWDPANALITTAAGNLERAQTITLGDTYTLSATLVNSFHATFNRRRDNRGPAADFINAQTIGVNAAVYVPNDLRVVVSNAFSVGCGTCSPGHFNVNNYQFAEDLDYIRGKHRFAFGVDVVRSQLNVLAGYLQNGSYSFNGQFTGDPLADFLTGTMNTFQQSRPQQVGNRSTNIGVYAQDTWHPYTTLTVNAGLRWEPTIIPTDLFHRGAIFSRAGFDANTHSSVYTTAPAGASYYGDPGVPTGFAPNHLWNFSPRLGFAWNRKGDGKETIRMGSAILYDSVAGYTNQRLTSNPPVVNEIDLTGSGPFSDPWRGYPGGNPFPGVYPPPKNAFFPTSALWILFPQDTKPTTLYTWNVSYQRQLPGNWLFSTTYIGNKTTHIWVGKELNPAVYAGTTSTTGNTAQRRLLYLANQAQGQYYGSMAFADEGVNAHYNGWLTSVEHRFTKGYTVLVNYTWSKCISEADFQGDITAANYSNPNNRRQDRGACNFDFRHIFNATSVITSAGVGNPVLKKLTGGWQLSPLMRIVSGAPLNVTSGVDNSRTGVGLDRPNLITNIGIYNDVRGPGLQLLNPAAFQQNAVGTLGNIGHDAFRGLAQINFDTSLSRTFTLREALKLEARAEGFNIINHTNFGNPTTAFNSGTFGRILSANDPRILQFALKVHF